MPGAYFRHYFSIKIEKMKKYNLLLSLVLPLFAGCADTTPTTFRIHGQLKDMGRQEVIMRYDGAASLVGDSRNIILHTDTAGKFDTILPLKQPEYYSISRNTLWLTPGDDLEVYITQNNREAQFKGKGAKANEYMKYRLFPKGGSYLEGGSNLKESFEATRTLIGELAAEREKQLDALTGVSADFKALERARIYADVINSYLCYSSYNRAYADKSAQEIREAEKEYLSTVMPEMQEKAKYLNDERYLNVAVVRDVLFYREDSLYAPIFNAYRPGDRCRELYESYGKVSALRHHPTQQLVDSLQRYISTMTQQDFAVELTQKVQQAARLLPGQPAPDFVMTDTAGNRKMLSDFKGKPIYIDLWATWCGPCIQESPAFTALSTEYPQIQFLQISRDEQRQSWLNYVSHKNSPLTQYNSVDLQLVEGWQLFYIPRFILIDKDQVIVDAYAPRPSSEEIRKVLDKLTQEK